MKKLHIYIALLLILSIKLFAEDDSVNKNIIFNLNLEEIFNVDALNYLSDYYLENSISLSNEFANKALSLSKKINYLEGEAKSYRLIAENCYYSNDINGTIASFNKAIEIYRNINNPTELVITYNRFSDFCKHLNIYELGFKYLAEALKISEQIGYTKGKGLTYISIGKILTRINMIDERLSFNKPLEYLNKAKKIFQDIKDTNLYLETLLNLGVLYNLRNIDSAFLYYKEMYNISHYFDTKHFLIAALRDMGIYYADKKQYDEGLKFLEQGYEVANSVPTNHFSSAFLTLIAGCYDLKGDYNNELKYHFEAKKIREGLGQNYLLASSFLNIGNTYLEHNKYDEAIKYLNKGVLLAIQSNNLEFTKKGYYKLYLLYSKTNDYNKALDYFEKYNIIKDSIIKNERQSQFEYIFYSSELEKIIKEKDIVEVDKKYITIFVLSALITLILILLFAIFKLYNTKKNDNKQLSEKNDLLNRTLHEFKVNIYENEVLRMELEERVLERTKELSIENEERKKGEENLRKSETEIKRSLNDKEVLLKEVHHRVKNNLQVMVSLMNLQSKNIDDPNMLAAIKANQQRIRSIGLIHEILYKSDSLSQIDFGSYIYYILDSLRSSLSENPDLIDLEIASKDLFLEIEKAVPLALIINEIISYSIKFTLPNDQKRKISFKSYDYDNYSYKISISDNGIGFSKEKKSNQKFSFEHELINLLVGQLNGFLEINNYSGTEFLIIFPKN